MARTASNPVSTVDTNITELKAERARIKAEKNKLTKDLRLSDRKRARLKAKAKALSSHDLVEVLQFRASDQCRVTANKKAKTTAAPAP